MNTIKLSMAAVIFCSSAYANEVVDLGDVSVTATKTLQSTLESPASVEIVSAKKIEEKSVQRADEAIKDVAGVYVRANADNTPNSWSNAVTLRGIPGYARTAVLIDDIPLNNAFSGGVNWSNIAVENISQIEVVKGPFSSLYGGNAMGGVINVITKEPAKREMTIKTGYGSNNFKNISGSYRDKISEKLGISLNFNRQESDGYINDFVVKTPSSGTGGTAVTGQVQTTSSTGNTVYIVGDKGKKSWWMNNAGINLFYQFDDVSKLTFGYTYHEHKTEFNSFNTYLKDGSGNPVYSGSVQLDTSLKASLSEKDFLFGPTGEETKKYTIGYETKLFNAVNAKIKAAYTDYDYWYKSQLTGAVSSGGSGSISDIPNTKTYVSGMIDFALGDMNYMVVGADLNKNELKKEVHSLSNWQDDSSQTSLMSIANGKSTTKAIFIQDTIDLNNEWSVYLGGRYDSWSTDGLVENYGTPSYSFLYNTRKDSQFSPKASVVYLPSKNTTLRASVGEAFKAPLLSDLYSTYMSGSKLIQANPNLKPEKTTSWELGFEQRFDTKTSLKATYYENYLTDLIYSTDVSATLNEKRNAGKAEIKGLELEVKQELAEGIGAFANFTYNKTKITKNEANPLLVGKHLTYVPEKQFNLGISGQKGDWSGSIIGNYVDDLWTKDDNSDVIKNVYGAYESYFTTDAKIGYQIQKWLNGSLAVNNIFDKEFYQNGLNPGRTLYAELTFKF
ncbi:MAG: TonB-dependent receptor [Sulfuricurvum sp.]|uniref:TonB-dependent receptor n=1 Tax=Sulfuricurvum sp. TaxID=2025608 RepID=UPI0026372539|nr:TonB-dependent receptor [Sulfuricurvum sp.]MDD2367853.1 TonB-dependent receptor [Sulfuricurvum sp.]MDD2949587.1 TonB-dependent receptor [Sulfuricurvum sp.]MDD5119018.1 TonB-dependent receptor [Sulfuricurvum sp.]